MASKTQLVALPDSILPKRNNSNRKNNNSKNNNSKNNNVKKLNKYYEPYDSK